MPKFEKSSIRIYLYAGLVERLLRLLPGIIETSAHLYLVSVSSLCPLLSAKPSQLASWPRPPIDVWKPKRTWHNFESWEFNNLSLENCSLCKSQTCLCLRHACSTAFELYQMIVPIRDSFCYKPDQKLHVFDKVASAVESDSKEDSVNSNKEWTVSCCVFYFLHLLFIILTWKERILALASAKQRFNSQFPAFISTSAARP